MRYHIILIILILSVQQAAGQSLAELERQLDSLLGRRARSEVTFSLGYGNNPAYGSKSTDPFRPLTMKPFLSPGISYNHKSGLFASVYGYYLFNASYDPWFETDLNIGYDYTKSRRLMTGISYTRYFYRDSSDVPPTPIRNELFAYFIYRKWWLEPGISLDLGWGKLRQRSDPQAERTVSGSDFNVIADLRHTFIYMDLLKNDDALLIMPVFSFTAGTANYYSNLKSFQYVSRSKLIQNRGKGKRGRGQPIQELEEIVSDNTGFQPRALDVSMRVSYMLGKFAVSPSYTLFRLLQGEDSVLTGYFTASVSLTL
ncbi:hypothetical protein [Chitinophaga sp. XS-30]|uniref:hypothetical protein n=1 Tax=Chitinophaga sp. XS-30 TaxID=2604421 RepID=UPI0011DD47D7|nr:hypothetical protein [Chitinophaga sp. XS-30]QEH41176.1 hypothetical protein FW415_09935 [Chitinophaga sp. XS-30]